MTPALRDPAARRRLVGLLAALAIVWPMLGLAEFHPLAGKHGLPRNIVMVYGPRDEDELEIVAALVRASYGGACAGDA